MTTDQNPLAEVRKALAGITPPTEEQAEATREVVTAAEALTEVGALTGVGALIEWIHQARSWYSSSRVNCENEKTGSHKERVREKILSCLGEPKKK